MKTLLFFILLSLGSVTFAQSWYQITVPADDNLNAIDFPSNDVGYIVGDSNLILKTTDGGQNWTALDHQGMSIAFGTEILTDVEFVDESIGFVTLMTVGVFKTVDGGLNWTQIMNQSTNQCFPYSLHVFDETNLLSGGADCFQGVTINHINSGVWTVATVNYMTGNTQEIVKEFDFYDANIGLAAMRGRLMLRTIDGGQTWDTIPTGLSPTGFLTSVMMVDDQLCYAGYDENGGGFGILVSYDGGLTWNQDGNSATFFYPAFLSVCHAANGDIYSGARSSNLGPGLIFETTDGTNWTIETVDQPIEDMETYADDITFGIGDSGFVVVNIPPSQLGLMTNELDVFKVYPNPTMDWITIENQDNLPYAYELFDTRGRSLMTLAESNQVIHKMNLSGLKDGLYFLHRMNIHGSQVVEIVKH